MLSNKIKKIALGLSAAGTAVAMLPMFAAFEAHVINVTAQIENALGVTTNSIDFGTVFPQEHLDQPLGIFLSGSFLEEDRVDDVEYIIRQKPKCGITIEDGTILLQGSTVTGHVFPGAAPVDPTHTFFQGDGYYVDCGETPQLEQGQTFGMLPLLCPYISKLDDKTPDNDGELPSFHQPFTVGSSTIIWNDVLGRLAKSEQDLRDDWTIDLAVPCFGDYCAQDWEDFVHGINPQANPDDYVQDIRNEHKVFGCDLWVEVTEVSESGTPPPPPPPVQPPPPPVEPPPPPPPVAPPPPPVEPAQLSVHKKVINDNGGNNVIADFQLTVDGSNVVSGATSTYTPGLHIVSETGVSGYAATFSGDCDSNGNVTLVPGQTKTCTVTNNDIAPTITLIKNVTNDDGGTATSTDFTLRIDGAVVPNHSSVVVIANANHTIDEDAKVGYTFSGISGLDCPGTLPGIVNLSEGQAIKCTITNDDNELPPPPPPGP